MQLKQTSEGKRDILFTVEQIRDCLRSAWRMFVHVYIKEYLTHFTHKDQFRRNEDYYTAGRRVEY